MGGHGLGGGGSGGPGGGATHWGHGTSPDPTLSPPPDPVLWSGPCSEDPPLLPPKTEKNRRAVSPPRPHNPACVSPFVTDPRDFSIPPPGPCRQRGGHPQATCECQGWGGGWWGGVPQYLPPSPPRPPPGGVPFPEGVRWVSPASDGHHHLDASHHPRWVWRGGERWGGGIGTPWGHHGVQLGMWGAPGTLGGGHWGHGGGHLGHWGALGTLWGCIKDVGGHWGCGVGAWGVLGILWGALGTWDGVTGDIGVHEGYWGASGTWGHIGVRGG